MNHLTFRSSRIIYYGPHACPNCRVLIAKMAFAFGGNAFTYPEGPIYPNTEWHPHVCDPKRVGQFAPPAPADPPDCPAPMKLTRVSIPLDANVPAASGVRIPLWKR